MLTNLFILAFEFSIRTIVYLKINFRPTNHIQNIPRYAEKFTFLTYRSLLFN